MTHPFNPLHTPKPPPAHAQPPLLLSPRVPTGQQHQIDGIILTKFDTVDLKVGAALSMCYKTGQPILFVGTGQKYTHLKKLNVREIINALFQ